MMRWSIATQSGDQRLGQTRIGTAVLREKFPDRRLRSPIGAYFPSSLFVM